MPNSGLTAIERESSILLALITPTAIGKLRPCDEDFQIIRILLLLVYKFRNLSIDSYTSRDSDL